MTDIAFYHLQRSPLERALPKLLEKTLAAGKRALVVTGSGPRVEALNALLWTYDQGAWLPHGCARDGHAEDQPIWITDGEDNPNNATFLFLTDGCAGPVADFERCFDMFDGNDAQSVAAARERWKTWKEEGHALAYWQQTETGGWAQKAY